MHLALDPLLRPGEGGRLPRHEQQGARQLSPMEAKPAEWRKGGKLCKDRPEPFSRREKGKDLVKLDMIQFSKKIKGGTCGFRKRQSRMCFLPTSQLAHVSLGRNL